MIRRGLARHRRKKGEDEGFTLIEIIVAIAVLSMIITPLTAAFISMLHRSTEVEDQLSRSADAQRIGAAWTKDVQSVEPGGINSAGTCPDPGGGSPVEVHLVTFSWDSSSSAGASKKSASWVAVGSGQAMQLVRRYCENDVPKGAQLLADRIGETGAPADQVVHGPSGSGSREFCPAVNKGTAAAPRMVSDTCTVVVDGAFSYRLGATRRVPESDLAGAPSTVPPPPTITGATGRNTFASVVWTPPMAWQPPVDGYRVHAYTDPNGSPVASAEVDGSSNSPDITGLANGTDYFFRAQSHNAIGWGELSAPFGPASPAPTVPEAPTILTVTPGDTTASVTWSAHPNDGGSPVTGWRIWAESSSGQVGPALVTGGGATSGTVTGLTNGTTYRLVVAALNSLGEGVRSTPSSPVVPFGIPGKATITSVTSLNDGKIRVAWAAPTVNPANASTPDGGRPVTGYRVVVASGPAAGPWPGASTWVPASTTQLDLSGLALGSSYTFSVMANNERGPSTSDPSSPAALSRALPGAPGSVSATQGGVGAVTVGWTAAAPNGSPVTGYEIRSSPATTVKSVSGSTFSTSFTGLTSGTTYTFYVKAINGAGAGPEASASATALGTPSAPQGVSVVRQPGNTYPFAVNVTWSRPANAGGGCIKGYRIEYSTNGSSVAASQALNSSPNGSCGGEPGTSLGWTNLPAGVQFRYFRVVGINTGNLEATSGWVNIAMTQQCVVGATEDSWVNEHNGGVFSSSSRGNNYGNDGNLRVDKSGDRLFVKFDPRSNGTACNEFGQALPASAAVTGGWVHLYNNSSTTFNRDHRLARANGGWSEGGITYNNRPGETNDSATQSASDGGWREFWAHVGDVNRQRDNSTRWGWTVRDVGGNGLSDWATYTSSEGNGSQRPYLRIVFY